ncbi:bifunctional folylpolyglutamate synthase/dihydrofolate synthase [Granulicoccus sp. GXG6511]|uniref:bifunctional folylpolyglutamate synthase/dihydrofolate synthase n=1 Tax=Granulicoccus sp. GXG6511 TaxID=3381351 RepID=UPI003D7D35FB
MATHHETLLAELTSRWPEHRIAPSLDRIRAVTELLGDPQRACPVIQITGTNGKGSTAIMIEALLRAAGLRTGRYSSPHLIDVTERIAIDGQPISKERFGETWADIKPYVEIVDQQLLNDAPMTFFEVLTAMAYAAFADAPVDVMIIEVGLGGTWDATNIADAQVAVVMPIDLDHTHLLGESIEEIAGEKAGIIKPGAHAILAGQPLDAARVLLQHCADVGALVQREGVDFGLLDRRLAVGGQLIRLNGVEGPVDDIHLPVHGVHMARNAGVALAAVEAFLGMKALPGDLVREGFAEVRAPGRLEAIRQSPPIVLDGAHNAHAAAASAEAVVEAYSFDPLIGVFAVMADKDAEAVLRVWEPVMNEIICTRVASTERGMAVDDLVELAGEVFGPGRVRGAASIADALEIATATVDVDAGQPGILVTGSVIAAGEARALLAADDLVRDADEIDWEADDHGGTLDELLAAEDDTGEDD